VSSEAGFDPTAPLTPSGSLRRRQLISRIAEFGSTAAAVLAVAVLGFVVFTIFSRGADALTWDFITKGAPKGVGPELVGTAIIVGIGTLIATPIGVLIALYVSEFAGGRASHLVKLSMDLMNGLPSIIIGLFIFGLLVAHKKQTAIAGSVALAIIMVPLIARGSQEVLALVPRNMREASDALGVSRWRAIFGIVLPSARAGILTAVILATARAAGETAPLLFASLVFDPGKFSFNPFEALPSVPVKIYTLSEEANPSGFTEAWGISFLLVAFILFASLGARALLARSKRKMAG
jgi:phosphate transport system permease protein